MGAVVELGELYKAYMAFSALDLAGPLEPSLGGFVELRLVAGSR